MNLVSSDGLEFVCSACNKKVSRSGIDKYSGSYRNLKCADGKVGAQCACCGQSPPIGNVTDLATVKVWSYTSWVRSNGDLSPTNQPAPNHVILHFECWCHRGHRIVLQYIKDHPEQDCSWMVEAYSQAEWNKILVDAGIRK